MLGPLTNHWPEYLMEGAELGILMVLACCFATLLEYPASPLHEALANVAARRTLMGAAMAATVVAIIYSPWGRQSGAHFNPAVTLTFFRLGKVAPWDAGFYVGAHFAGGLAGLLVAAAVLGRWLADPAVNYAVTTPGVSGSVAAFAAELVTSFIFMTVVLVAINAPRLERFTGLFVGVMVMTFIAKMYGAALLRLRKEDFGEIRHHGGISPAWPLSYEDFEPCCPQAEHLYHVHGQHGVGPTEPPASAPYRHAPVSHEPRIQDLFDALQQLGYRPFPLPLGILLDEQNGKPTHTSVCVRCNAFDGFPCLVNGKADAQIICVEPALQHPNVQLLTGAYVRRLETDASGREVTKVHVERNGAREAYSADIVVVACGAVNSAALLLRSADDKHPKGLANRSDVVGRHYMRHNNSAVLAISKTPNPTVFQKTLGLNDFYHRADDWDYPLGHIQMLGKSDAEMMKAEAPDWAIWKPRLPLEVIAQHSLHFWLTSEDLPDPENRVTLTADGEIVLQLKETNMEGHKRLTAKLRRMLEAVGCQEHLLPRALYLGKRIPIGGTAHQVGTVRFGRDPQTSALDVSCKAHDLDNLYVVDGSFFVSSGAVNPALTIIANALRVGDHLLKRLR